MSEQRLDRWRMETSDLIDLVEEKEAENAQLRTLLQAGSKRIIELCERLETLLHERDTTRALLQEIGQVFRCKLQLDVQVTENVARLFLQRIDAALGEERGG